MANKKHLEGENGKNDDFHDFDNKSIRDITLNFVVAARDTTRFVNYHI